MTVPIRECMPTPGQYAVKCPYAMEGKGVVFHNTADSAKSAIDWARQRLGNGEQSSIHFFVDEKEAVLCSPLDRNTWHAADGRDGYANRNLWSVEVCRSMGDLKTFLQAERNAAWVVAWLLTRHGLRAGGQTVRWHFEFAATACPHRTREQGLWRIVPMVERYMEEMEGGDSGMVKTFTPTGSLEVLTAPDAGASIPPGGGAHTERWPQRTYAVYAVGQIAGTDLPGVKLRLGGGEPKANHGGPAGADNPTESATNTGGGFGWAAKVPGRYVEGSISLEEAEQEGLVGGGVPQAQHGAVLAERDILAQRAQVLAAYGGQVEALGKSALKIAAGIKKTAEG